MVGLWMPVAWAHSDKATVSVKTYTPITVDGSLEDWVRRLEESNWVGRLQVQKGLVAHWMRAVPTPLNALTAHVAAGTIVSPADFSASVYTLWDDQRFYVAAIVTDDEVVTQHQQAAIAQDDALELWCDCRHDAVTHTLMQDDEYHLGFSPGGQPREHAEAWAWQHAQANEVVSAMAVASSLTPSGYLLEASVPWEVLNGCQPAVGSMIGLNISIGDKDSTQPRRVVIWSGQRESDPTQFGHLYFVDAPVDLFASDVLDGPPENATEAPVVGGSP